MSDFFDFGLADSLAASLLLDLSVFASDFLVDLSALLLVESVVLVLLSVAASVLDFFSLALVLLLVLVFGEVAGEELSLALGDWALVLFGPGGVLERVAALVGLAVVFGVPVTEGVTVAAAVAVAAGVLVAAGVPVAAGVVVAPVAGVALALVEAL